MTGAAVTEAGREAAAGRLRARALALLLAGGRLRPTPSGRSFALLQSADLRRRARLTLPAALVRELVAEGALAEAEGALALTPAGAALARRCAAAGADEAFLAQHGPIVARTVMDADGAPRAVRGRDADGPVARLAQTRDPDGDPFFAPEELAAARRLYADWAAGQIGLIGGSDWRAPPRGSAPRGPGGGAEAAQAGAVDARRQVERALAALAAPLRQALSAVLWEEAGFGGFERTSGWPARTGRWAVKLALSQLALGYRGR